MKRHHLKTPSVQEVERIAGIGDPNLRNLEITQCYKEISAAFAARISGGANWCTFATWASKQAGQTIRKEDLRRTIKTYLEQQPEIEAAVSFLAQAAKKAGISDETEPLRQAIYRAIIEPAASRASDAVSRGNQKVFVEIALEFARFIGQRFDDKFYEQKHIDAFCAQLKPGPPPQGQEYLQRAFRKYYRLLFETDKKKLAEGTFFANVLIGAHEQMRLQPEIAESLNTAVDKAWIKKKLLAEILPKMSFWRRIIQIFRQLFRRNDLLDKAIDALAKRAQKHLRYAMTANLMTITFPLSKHIHLGKDLSAGFALSLATLEDAELLALLKKVDPTADSISESGASDWANLDERMHFIADLFRCYHEHKPLFNEAFTSEQLAKIKAGVLPGGEL